MSTDSQVRLCTSYARVESDRIGFSVHVQHECGHEFTVRNCDRTADSAQRSGERLLELDCSEHCKARRHRGVVDG